LGKKLTRKGKERGKTKPPRRFLKRGKRALLKPEPALHQQKKKIKEELITKKRKQKKWGKGVRSLSKLNTSRQRGSLTHSATPHPGIKKPSK